MTCVTQLAPPSPFSHRPPIGDSMDREAHGAGEQTQFLNVDLDVESSGDLSSLVTALGPVAFTLHDVVNTQGHRVSFELNGNESMDAESTIQRFVDAIMALPGDARHCWNNATVRRFSIGIQAGVRPHSFVVGLKLQTLESLVSLASTVEFVVYSATPAQN